MSSLAISFTVITHWTWMPYLGGWLRKSRDCSNNIWSNVYDYTGLFSHYEKRYDLYCCGYKHWTSWRHVQTHICSFPVACRCLEMPGVNSFMCMHAQGQLRDADGLNFVFQYSHYFFKLPPPPLSRFNRISSSPLWEFGYRTISRSPPPPTHYQFPVEHRNRQAYAIEIYPEGIYEVNKLTYSVKLRNVYVLLHRSNTDHVKMSTVGSF